MVKDITFSFGDNWDKYVDSVFSEERLEISKTHILEFLNVKHLKGIYFLDVGCGSGLSSAAAFRSDVDKIVGFDFDPKSVRATKKVREACGNPANWEVFEGSILDKELLKKIKLADIVYSWGVLHHTGAMWEAMGNASTLIKPGGLFYIAIYGTNPEADYWLKIKQLYNKASENEKRWMEIWYIMNTTIIPSRLAGEDPSKKITDYKTRGMEYYTDVRDWLGGYPYEHATPEEVIGFCKNELKLEFIRHRGPEFLFKK